MASFEKFDQFVANVANKVHNLGSDTLKIMLVNSPSPTSSDSVKADLTEIAPGNGYVAGGPTVVITSSAQSGGVYELLGNDLVITATGGTIGPFRYAVLYNNTPTSPLKPLIGFWDYGSSLSLLDAELLTVDLSQVSGILALQ